MKEIGFDISVLSGDGFNGEEVVTSEYTQGMMYTLAKIDTPEEFKDRIHAMKGYKDLEISIAAPYAYDATRIFIKVLSDVGTDNLAIKETLGSGVYSGITNNVITFDQQGDLVNAEFELKEIRNKKSVTIG